MFCKLHNKNPEDNLGDVKNIDATKLDVDLLVFGSPCQSFTRGGRNDGGEKGSDTKSSLMWEAVRIMEECKPKWIIWENVPDALSKKNISNFNEYMSVLDELNYNTYYDVLNAHELGSAQKRKRLFSVSIRKDIDNMKYNFEHEKIEPRKLVEYLETNVTSSDFNLDKKVEDILVLKQEGNKYYIKNGNIQGYMIAQEGDAIDYIYYNSKTRRGRVQHEACHTLLRSRSVGTIQNGKFRWLTPYEYWKLQELPLELYRYVEECDFSVREGYDVIGGMINQVHLKTVLGNLKKAFDW